MPPPRSAPSAGPPPEPTLGPRPCGPDRVKDAPSAVRDLRVSQALRLPVDLPLPRTGEHGVGVGVDEAGGDGPPPRVDRPRGARVVAEDLRRDAPLHDASVDHVHGAVLEDPELGGRSPGPGTRGPAGGGG